MKRSTENGKFCYKGDSGGPIHLNNTGAINHMELIG